MNVIKKTLGALMAAGVVALGSCGPNLPELPVSEVQPYFGDAAKTKAIDTAFYEVKDAKGHKVGLYDAWIGLTVDEALNKEVDAVSGATYTSNGVKNSLKARLQAYQRQVK